MVGGIDEGAAVTDEEFLKLSKPRAEEALHPLRDHERVRLAALYSAEHGEKLSVRVPGADLAVAKLTVSVVLVLAVAGCTYFWFGT